jgi:hypothetical protein
MSVIQKAHVVSPDQAMGLRQPNRREFLASVEKNSLYKKQI